MHNRNFYSITDVCLATFTITRLNSLKFDCLKNTKHTTSLIKFVSQCSVFVCFVFFIFAHKTISSESRSPPFHTSRSLKQFNSFHSCDVTVWILPLIRLRQTKIENRVYANRIYIGDDTMFHISVPCCTISFARSHSFLFLLLFLRVFHLSKLPFKQRRITTTITTNTRLTWLHWLFVAVFLSHLLFGLFEYDIIFIISKRE